MLERPGYTSKDHHQYRLTWELAHVADAALWPDRTHDRQTLTNMERILWARYGTERARWNERTAGVEPLRLRGFYNDA